MKKRMMGMMVYAFLLMLASVDAHSQYYYYNNRFYETNLVWEIGASAVALNALTDLGGKKATGGKFLTDLDWRSMRPGFALYGRVLYSQVLGIRMETLCGKMVATDNLAANKQKARARFDRNMQVESNIMELLLLAELYPLTILTGRRHPIYLVNPYLVIGLGVFHFDPVAVYQGYKVKLAPLHTEGQGFPEYPGRKPYARDQFNIPLGLGFRYEISALVICGMEVIYRKLFTDYLDDASTAYIDPKVFYRYLSPADAAKAAALADPRFKDAPPHQPGDVRGNPSKKDAYLSMNLKLAIALGRERR